MQPEKVVAGRFEIKDFIAHGGMGTVHRGVDRQTGQVVAIKQLRSDLALQDSLTIERFIHEGEVLRRLNHPNIVKMLEMILEEGQYFIIMEYVSGGSLNKLLQTESQLPVGRVLAIALELSDALARAHHLKIIHRDIKPDNILLAEDGTPRLTDFGVASMGTSSATEVGTVVGTLHYLPPEALDGDSLDARADLWSLGIVLFEMLAGRHPFEGGTVLELLSAIATKPTPDLEALRKDAPVSLIDLIYRMLQKDRKARIPSARQVAAELQAITEGIPNQPTKYNTLFLPEPKVINLTTPTPVRYNLPAQTTAFVGRAKELAEIAQLLADPANRLVSILAPGGMGKTRVALEVASRQLERFKNGVFFVSLAPLTQPEAIVSTIAQAVQFQFAPDSEPKAQLLNHFRAKQLLLVLDNFEHILAGTPLVTEILQAAPEVKIIATSRERLALDEEQIFRIEGMDFADWKTPEEALEWSTAQLFVQSARRVQPAFSLNAQNVHLLARICRLVQGMPLGILLAAAWVEMLSLDEIASEIEANIDFLESNMRNTPARHRSIRAVFDYSWSQLTSDEQNVFMRASIFRGGFTREAAVEIAGASLKTLMVLINKSLLRRDPSGRYEIHELLRQYAGEKLIQAGLLEITEKKHYELFSKMAEQAEPELRSKNQLVWLDRLDAEHDNIRFALQWAAKQNNDVELVLSLAWRLAYFWEIRGFHIEAHKWLNAYIGKSADIPMLLQAHALLATAWFVPYFTQNGRYELLKKALEFYRAVDAEWYIAYVTSELGDMMRQQDLRQALLLMQDGLARAHKIGDLWLVAAASTSLGGYYLRVNQSKEAVTYFTHGLNLYQEVGDTRGVLLCYECLGATASQQGDIHRNIQYLEKSLPLARQTRNRRMIAIRLLNLTILNRFLGNFDLALQYGNECLEHYRDIADRLFVAHSLKLLGLIAQDKSDFSSAENLLNEALTIYRQVEQPFFIAEVTQLLGDNAYYNGFFSDAKRLYQEALAWQPSSGQPNSLFSRALPLIRLGNIGQDESDAEVEKWYKDSLAIINNANNTPPLLKVLLAAGYVGLYARQKKLEQAALLIGAIDAHLKARGFNLLVHEQRIYEADKARVRDQFDETTFSQHYQEGQRLTLAKAIELASTRT